MVDERYPGFFTCPTTWSIKIVCPTGIEFPKSSEAFPHAAKNCDRLAVWKSQSENFSRLAIVGKYILGIPAVQLYKSISYITLHTSSPWLGLGSVQAQVTQSQSTNTKSSGRAARYPSVEIERKNTVLGFPIEDGFLVLVNHCPQGSFVSQPQKSSKASISTTPNQTELWPDLTSIYNQMVTSPEGGWRHSDRYTVTDMCQSVLLFGHPCTRLNKIYYMSHNKKLLSTAKPAPPMPSWTVAPGLPINPIPPFLWPSIFQCVDVIWYSKLHA